MTTRPSLFRKLLRWLLFVFAALVTLLVLAYSLSSFLGRNEWAQTQKELRQKGEKLSLIELAPPPVPDEANFFAAPVWKPVIDSQSDSPDETREKPLGIFSRTMKGEGGRLLTPPGGLEILRRRDLGDAAQFLSPETGERSEAASAAVVLTALDAAAGELEEIQRAAERPEARFPADYDKGIAMPVPHLTVILSLAQYLSFRIVAETAAGRNEAALNHLLLIFYLADSMKEEPLLISQLVRLSVLQIAVSGIWEGIDRHAWNDGHLSALQERLDEFRLEDDLRLALRGERGALNHTLEQLIEKNGFGAVLGALLGNGPAAANAANLFGIYPRGWILADLSFINRLLQDVIEKGSSWEQAGYWNETVEPELMKNLEWPRRLQHLLSSLALPAYGGVMKHFQKTETRLRQARIAIALERYRRAKGHYPERLNELVPSDLSALPLDVCSGESFRYRRPAPDQFILWSVGPDRTDDHGTPMLKSSDPTGDWVWKTLPPPTS